MSEGKEGEKRGDSVARDGHGSSFDISRLFGNIFRWGLRLIGIVAILGILGFIIFIFFNYQNSGALEAWTKDVSVSLDENVKTGGFLSFWEDIMNPTKAKTYSSIIEDNEDNNALGVKIISFEGTPSEYIYTGTGSPHIRSTALIEASSLSGDISTAIFECELDDYSGKLVLMPQNITYPGNGRVQRQTVFCTTDNEGYLELDPKTLNTKTMKFKALFDSVTLAHYDAYIMRESEYYDLFGANNVDPWIYFLKSRPELLDSRNVMKSRSTGGPINLGLGTGDSQPFLDGNLVPFQISLTPNWNGEIKYLKSITLRVPQEIELEEDPLFCDFQFTGDYDGDYRLYNLTSYALNEKVNKDCSPESIAGTGLSERSCMKYFKTDLQLQCLLKILPFDEGDSKFYLIPIEAEANYVFALEKSINIHIRGQELS